MNFVFYLLIIVAVVALWFLLAFLFKPVGKFFNKLNEDVKDAMELNEEEKNENKNEKG